MQYWRPVPQALLAELLMHRWTPQHPAPEAVGYLVAVDRIMSGAPFSARKLAEYCGWTRWHASQLQASARTFCDEWQGLHQPAVTASTGPPVPNDNGHMKPRTSQKPARNQPETSHRGRAKYKNTTPQEHPSHTKVDLSALWEQMEDVRLAVTTGGKRAKLGKRRHELRLRVQEHGEEAVLHCWRWWWQAGDQRARFLREGGYGISTFLRAGKLRDYMDRATAWDPAADQALADWYTDEDFDEQGNLRQQ